MAKLDDYTMPETFNPLPVALEAEKTILGAIILEPERLIEIAASLEPSDFSLDSHVRIFGAMIAINQRDGSVDTVTLCQELVNRKEIEAVGGWAYVNDLTSGLPRHPVIENYVKILKDKAICRALIGVSEGLSSRAYSQDVSGLEIAAWALGAVSAIAEDGESAPQVFSAADMVVAAEERLLRPPADNGVIPFGIANLDAFTNGGMRRGELWIIGAPPSRREDYPCPPDSLPRRLPWGSDLCSLRRNDERELVRHYRLSDRDPTGLEGARPVSAQFERQGNANARAAHVGRVAVLCIRRRGNRA